jgi:hypothetical protein
VRYLNYSTELMEQRGLLAGSIPPGSSGFGWAARAEVLRRVLLYDRAIVGGGDRLILGASYYRKPFLQQVESLVKAGQQCTTCGWQWHSALYTKHFLDWASKWQEEVQGSIGYAPNTIKDLFHGPRKHRFYKRRRRILARNGYDPSSDVIEDANEVLKWASDKEQLHESVKMYFRMRREDT